MKRFLVVALAVGFAISTVGLSFAQVPAQAPAKDTGSTREQPVPAEKKTKSTKSTKKGAEAPAKDQGTRDQAGTPPAAAPAAPAAPATPAAPAPAKKTP